MDNSLIPVIATKQLIVILYVKALSDWKSAAAAEEVSMSTRAQSITACMQLIYIDSPLELKSWSNDMCILYIWTHVHTWCTMMVITVNCAYIYAINQLSQNARIWIGHLARAYIYDNHTVYSCTNYSISWHCRSGRRQQSIVQNRILGAVQLLLYMLGRSSKLKKRCLRSSTAPARM